MLNWAVFYDKQHIVKYLVEKEKHRVNEYCNNSCSFGPRSESPTPLYNAVLKENPRMVRYPSQKNADVNLMEMVQTKKHHMPQLNLNNLQILKILVKAGADLDTQTPDGDIAYDIAVSSGNKELIEYLVKNGARTEVNEDEIRPIMIRIN